MGAIAEERVNQIVSLPTLRQPMPILDAALLAHRSGLCVVPPREDGSKRPMGGWAEYQRRTSTQEEIRRWYGRGLTGLGIVCGEVSGRLELLEFEGRAVTEGLWQDFKNAAAQTGLGDLVERIKGGYGERTPSRGYHLLYRCADGVEGSTELARRPPTEEEAADDERGGKRPAPRVLIETRGEGGYVIVAPSAGRVHHSGRAYELVHGGFDSVVTISATERAALLELARSLDRSPATDHVREDTPSGGRADDRMPGTDFNHRGDWAPDVLKPAGWSLTGTDREGRQRWYRAPNGRPDWTSATVSPDGEILYVFSTSTELPTRVGLTKFAAYTHLHHAGDFRAAARALHEQGYGQRAAEVGVEAGIADDGASLPVVICTDRGLRDLDGQPGMADDALRALVAANAHEPFVFERARQLVRVGQSKAGPNGACHPVIELISRDALAGELATTAWFVTVGGRDHTQRRVSPPETIVRDVLSRGSWEGLPSLSGVVVTPVARPDGSILTRPGYDPTTWLFYAPRPDFVLPSVPDRPTATEMQQAVDLLEEALCDFPFADTASRANAYALLLTPFIRHMLGDGLVPMAVIDAPTPGTGKGLLLDLTALVSTGNVVPKRSPASDNDEWRKELLAAAMEGANYFVIDNATEPLGSAALDSAITAGKVTGRVLGQSREAVVSITWTWVATGNNIVVRGDLARRCYWIRMISPLADPSKRTGFRHPELLPWASENRPPLVAAVLTLVRAWFSAGKPRATTPAFGSFERWTGVVGGMLAHAGVDGFLGNLDTFRKRVDRARDEWETFVAAWWSVLPNHEVTVGELTRRMLEDVAYTPLRDALPSSLSRQFDRARPDSYRGFATAFGAALTKIEGRRFGDDEPLMLVKAADPHAKTATWQVSKAPMAAPSAGQPDAVGAENDGLRDLAGPSGRAISDIDAINLRDLAGPSTARSEVPQVPQSFPGAGDEVPQGPATVASSECVDVRNGAKKPDFAGPAGPAGPFTPTREREQAPEQETCFFPRGGKKVPQGPAGPASPKTAAVGPAAAAAPPSPPAAEPLAADGEALEDWEP